MQDFRSLKKKTSGSGSSLLDATKGRGNDSSKDLRANTNPKDIANISPYGRQAPMGTHPAPRSDRSLNNSNMSDRRVASNGSWNSNYGTDRRMNSNGSMGAGTPSPHDHTRPPRSNSSQDSRHKQRIPTEIQEPEPGPPPSQYDLIWHQGDLALQFTLNGKKQIVIRHVEQNLPKETTAGLQSASPGDVLVALNWDDVTSLSASQIQDRLNRAELPLTLTFQSLALTSRSNRAPSIPRMPPLSHGEFDALWSNGRLGVVIACDPNGRPFVREYAKEASTDSGVATIQPLDQLLFVNDIQVAEIGYDQAMMTLRHAQKPVLLRFKRPVVPETVASNQTPRSMPLKGHPQQAAAPRKMSSQSRDNRYSIMWTDGPLGMVLKKSESDDIYIKELKERGLALQHRGFLAEGDILVSITGVPTKPLGLSGTVDFLKSVQKPVELIFDRSQAQVNMDRRARQSTMVVLPLPSDELSNDSFISDGVAAKYLNKSNTRRNTNASHMAESATYDLIWHRGKLAISLRYASSNQTVIRKVTIGEEQTTANIDAAEVGDVLVAINWEDVTAFPYDDVVARLKERDFPLTLSFRRGQPQAKEVRNVLPKGDFEVLWREGKLGVKIHCDPEGRAIVRGRTAEVPDPELSKIEAGDELIAVNDIQVKKIGYSEALVHMKKTKPIKLKFRRQTRRPSAPLPLGPVGIAEPSEVHLDSLPPSSSSPRQSLAASRSLIATAEDHMYSVDWVGGSLGITLRMNETFEIYIAQLTGKGLSLDCPDMRNGDLLIGVMGVPTAPLGLAGTVDFLKCIQKPAVLTFLRKASPITNLNRSTGTSEVNVSAKSRLSATTLDQPGEYSNLDVTMPKVEHAPLTPPTAPSVPLVSPGLAPQDVPIFTPKESDSQNWTSIDSLSLEQPVSPSSQLKVSLRSSSNTSTASGVIPSPFQATNNQTSLRSPPVLSLGPSNFPTDQHILSPVQNVSIGPTDDGLVEKASHKNNEPLTPPGTPPNLSVVISRPPVLLATTEHNQTSAQSIDSSSATTMPSSFVISRPEPTQVMSPTLSVSSEPVTSPVVTFQGPKPPPGTPPNVSVVISRPMVSRNTTNQVNAQPATPPGTPPPEFLDPWANYVEPTQADQITTETGGESVAIKAGAPVTPPSTPPLMPFGQKITEFELTEPNPTFDNPTHQEWLYDDRGGSIADLPDYRGTEDGGSFALMHGDSLHSTANPIEGKWLDQRGGSIADLPDFRSQENFQQPNMYKPDRVLTTDIDFNRRAPAHADFGPPMRIPKQGNPPANSIVDGSGQSFQTFDGQAVGPDYVSPLELEIQTTNGPFSPNLTWDIARDKRTPTHQTPTAGTSMVPLYVNSKSPSIGSRDSLSVSDDLDGTQSVASSNDFLSTRSLTAEFLSADQHAGDFNNGKMPMTEGPKLYELDTISLDEGEVDIDDDDDEGYSTIAPEDVPILLSMSSRSLSSASMPPTPPPIPAPLPEEEDVPQTLYSVLWRGGPLGLAIKRNKFDEISVKGLTGGGLAGSSDIIEAGDILVQCGTKIVQHLSLAETSKVLKEAQTPVSLVFLRRGGRDQALQSNGSARTSAASVPTLELSTNSYDNSRMQNGPASTGNLTFMSDSDPTMTSRGSVFMPKKLPSNKYSTVYSIVWEGGPLGIAVTKNSDDENCIMKLTGEGLASQSTIIHVGDVLVAAGDVQVAHLTLTAAMQVIRLARKPTFLVFRRPGEDEDV